MQKKKTKSLRGKFVLRLNLVVAALLLVALVGSYLLASAEFWSSTEESIALATEESQRQINTIFNERESILETQASDFNFLDTSDWSFVNRFFAGTLERYPDMIDVYATLSTPQGAGPFYSAVDWVADDPTYDPTQQEWYEIAAAAREGVAFTSPYVDEMSGAVCVTMGKAILGPSGEFRGVIGLDMTMDFLMDFCKSLQILDTNGTTFLLDSDGNVLSHPNADFMPKVVNGQGVLKNYSTIGVKNEREVATEVGQDGGLRLIKAIDYDGVEKYIATMPVPDCNWTFGVAVAVSDFAARQSASTVGSIILALVAIPLAILIITLLVSRLLGPVYVILAGAKQLATGDPDVNIDVETNDELGELAHGFAAMAASTREQVGVMQSMAEGDFTKTVRLKSDKDALSSAINNVSTNIQELIGEISKASEQVSRGSKQIADGAQSLAQGSTEQAAAVEQLSASISNVTEKTTESAEMASKAADLAGSIKETAEKGTRQMDDMMLAVRDIGDAAQSIERVIKVIDDIAFQTNILALNAAVEAARAGQHGRGFAVVAEEVRNLASKSSEAAKDTGALIANSIEKAQLGTKIASQTSESLSGIVTGIHESDLLMRSIAKSADEQAAAITQINHGIGQVAQVVNQNSATAEESAAASEEMSSQSEMLMRLVEQFHVEAGGSKAEHLPPVSGSFEYDAGGFGKY